MSYLSQNVSNDDWVQPDSVVRVGNELYVKDAYGTKCTSFTKYYLFSTTAGI